MLGLGLSVTQLAARGLRLTDLAAAIRALFAAGEQGVWYDPSDLSTLFQDAAGTTPVTAVEQPVGLMLDKSKGLVLGPELVTNGDFSAGTTGWVSGSPLTSTAAVVGGEMQVTATVASGRQIQGFATVAGRSYRVVGQIRKISGAGTAAYLALTNSAGGTNTTISNTVPGAVATTATFTFTATDSTSYVALSCWSSGDVCGFDNISVRELPGNHAYQTTSVNRPVLSARYNLLTKTEQFDDAVWVKSGATVTANAATAPNGTLTADKLVEDTANAQHPWYQQLTVSAGTLTYSAHIKRIPGSSRYVALYSQGVASAWAIFDPTVGSVTATGGNNYVSSAVVLVSDNWYRCSITFAATSGSLLAVAYLTNSSVTPAPSYTGDGTSGIYIWGADLRVANDGVNLPPYQRVNTATDYDTVGFPPYLSFNGSNQWMQTNSIDFTATDKMTVFAGVRKLSDAASGVVCEINTSSANGFGLLAPSTNGANSYRFFSAGSLAGAFAGTGVFAAAPITNTLTGIGNISGDQAVLRVNGTQAAIDTADQGTGNYGNYPLYIGARAGASLWFNGRLYQLVARGAQSTDQQIIDAERYINEKTRAY